MAPVEPLFPCLLAPRDRVVLKVGADTLTDRQLARACRRHADALADAGIGPGERVGVWTQGELATAVAFVGNALAGVVSVPLNPKIGAAELAHVASDAAPRRCYAARPDQLPECHLGPAIALAVDLSSGSSPEDHALREPASDRDLLVLYTSGTTGPPKGAPVRASAVAANLDALAQVWGWRGDDVVVHALPLFHVHGLVLGLFGGLRGGGGLRWHPRFDPAELAADLDARSLLFAVPTMYVRLADLAERDPAVAAGLRRARLRISGSAGLAAREHRRLAALGCDVYERYGLTETLICCAVPAQGPPRPGLVGPPLPGMELHLVDDARRPITAADDATIGEVAVRGPSVFAGYLHRPDATEAVLDAAGWFYTGDLATRCEDGSLRIVGRRATDLIKTGGFKVGAGEIEACLLDHPDVVEVAVVGVPDDDLGERIVAYVVPRDRARPPAGAALCEDVARALAPHKRPREVVFVDALPRNAMGKIQKAQLRGAR